MSKIGYPVLSEVIAKVAFLSTVCLPNYAIVHVIMPHQRSSTLQEEELTNEGRHLAVIASKPLTREALQTHCMRT